MKTTITINGKPVEIELTYRSMCKIKRKFKDLQQPEEHKLIPLTQGKFAKVDNEEFDNLKNIIWHFDKGYARNNKYGRMHRIIKNTPDNLLCDHINGDTLDNRKENLRNCSAEQSSMNTKSYGTSKYKGVSFDLKSKKWVAQIQFKGVKQKIGLFHSEEDCAKAYDLKAIELQGEFARLNFKNSLSTYDRYING